MSIFKIAHRNIYIFYTEKNIYLNAPEITLGTQQFPKRISVQVVCTD